MTCLMIVYFLDVLVVSRMFVSMMAVMLITISIPRLLRSFDGVCEIADYLIWFGYARVKRRTTLVNATRPHVVKTAMRTKSSFAL